MRRFAIVNMKTGELRTFVDRIIWLDGRTRSIGEREALEQTAPGHQPEWDYHLEGGIEGAGVLWAGDWRSLTAAEKAALGYRS